MIPLHRKVYLIGALITVIAVAGVMLALITLNGFGDRSRTLVARAQVRAALGTAQADIARAQLQIAQARSAGSNGAAVAATIRAITVRNIGYSEWLHYERLARDAHALPAAAAATMNSDLTALRSSGAEHTLTHSTSGSALPQTAAAVSAAAARASQVQVDFGAVAAADQAWWNVHLTGQEHAGVAARSWVILVAAIALALVGISHGLLARAARRRDAELADRDRSLARVAAANEFEARLQRALELSVTEERVFGVVRQSLEEAVPDLSVEMLLADSSRAHFHQLATTGNTNEHWCSVDSPTRCPAAQRGELLSFDSSSALDACPFLKEQATACSAVCVPVSVSGLTVGVVHAAGPDGDPPAGPRRAALELVSRRASDRIGMMRAIARSETEASTDPLTGLPNRRSLENAVRQLTASGAPYAVAFGDLDHFKTVNDKYGHSAGDRALRVFARVLTDGLRPDDLYGRYGGEEFLIVLPACSEAEALRVLERIREQLAVTLMDSDCPQFTASFGLALSKVGQRFDSVVSLADAALLEAKRQGRNRVVTAAATAVPEAALT